MNDQSLAKLLGFDDANLVRTVAEAYAGYGLTHCNEFEFSERAGGPSSPSTMALAASAFACAGGYFAVVDAGSAALTFWAAAMCYAQMGALRSLAFAVCARATVPKTVLKTVLSAADVLMPEDVAALFLSEAMSYARRDRYNDVDRRADHLTSDVMRAAEVAGMRTRVDDFRALLLATADFEAAAEHAIAPVVAIIVGAAELVRRARQDTFHWKQLQSAVSPVPLEGLAAAVVYYTLKAGAGPDDGDPLFNRLAKTGFAEEVAIVRAGHSLVLDGLEPADPTPALIKLAELRRRLPQNS